MEALNNECIGCGDKPPAAVIVGHTIHTGLGDLIASITKTTGLDVLSDIYEKITGKECGCIDRQEALNKLFPFGVKENTE
ncbi:MAG: hypothetical protein WCI45_00225 [Desulfuromonadales bacterium]